VTGDVRLMNACKRWPGRAGAGGSVTGGTIEKRSAAPRGPLDQNAAPTTPPARQSFLARNKCRLPLASGARAKNNADLRGLQTAGRTMPETCRRMFRPPYGRRAQGPCDRLFGACGYPRWSPPRPVVGIGLPARVPAITVQPARRHHASSHLRCGIAIATGRNRTCI
jgi:hypothetical protein